MQINEMNNISELTSSPLLQCVSLSHESVLSCVSHAKQIGPNVVLNPVTGIRNRM